MCKCNIYLKPPSAKLEVSTDGFVTILKNVLIDLVWRKVQGMVETLWLIFDKHNACHSIVYELFLQGFSLLIVFKMFLL